MAKNHVFHNRTCHIAIKHHFIQEAIKEGEIQLKFCRSEDQVADILTKALPKENLQHLREVMGVYEHHVKGEYVE